MAFQKDYIESKDLVTINQAMNIDGVSRRTIYNWINNNKIDYCRTASGSIRIVKDTLFSKHNIPCK